MAPDADSVRQETVTWVRELPLDADIAAAIELSDGYALAGTSAHPERGDKDLLLIRLDGAGNELWRRTYGGTEKEYGYGLATTEDGGFILCGQTSSFNDYGGDVYVVRTDSQGTEQWTNSYGAIGTDTGVAVLPTNDGAYHILGRTYQGGNGLEIYQLTLDSSGALLNERTIGGPDDQFLAAAKGLPGGKALLAGARGRLNFAELQPLVMKIDLSSGEEIWTSEGGTDRAINPETVSVAVSPSGEVLYSAGAFEAPETELGARPIEREPEGQKIHFLKYSADGGEPFLAVVGDSAWSEPRALMVANDGSAVVAGTTRAFGAGGNDILLFKFGSEGDQVWSGTIGEEGDETLQVAITSNDGGFLLVAERQEDAARQLWLLKTDSRGQVLLDGQPLRSANLVKRTDKSEPVDSPPSFLTEDAPKLGETAPELNVGQWFNTDESLTLADLRGKVVVVELWATWCGPCRTSTPHLVELSERYADNVVFLGLTDEEPAAAPIEDFIAEFGIPYPVGAKSTANADYGVTGIPTAFVVDEAGVIQWVGHPMDNLASRIDAVLND